MSINRGTFQASRTHEKELYEIWALTFPENDISRFELIRNYTQR